MKLAKIKTDKSDAKSIYDYSTVNEVSMDNSLNDAQSQCFQS